MNLTTAQQTTLAADINAQGSLAVARAARDWTTIAAFYNANAASNVWRPDVPVAELNTAVNWVVFATKTAIIQNAFFAMTQTPTINATAANIRAGFGVVFAGADLTALSNISQRVGTRLEVLLVSVVGPPAVSQVFGQKVEELDVQRAMGF